MFPMLVRARGGLMTVHAVMLRPVPCIGIVQGVAGAVGVPLLCFRVWLF